MAFKILSQDELELLTEKQRNDYEKRLMIYYDRLKFIEQLEKYEQMEIKPYEPKFSRISVIKKAPNKEFKKPNYSLTKINHIKNPVNDFGHIKFDKSIKAEIPKNLSTKNEVIKSFKPIAIKKSVLPVTRIKSTPVACFIKPKKSIPFLPDKNITDLPKYSFIMEKNPQIKLPDKIKPDFIRETAFNKENINIDITNLKNNKLKNIPYFGKKTNFIFSKIMDAKLPAVKFKLPYDININFSKKRTPNLPNKMETNSFINNVTFKYENNTIAKIPDISNKSLLSVKYNNPDIKKCKLPITQKFNIPDSKNKFNLNINFNASQNKHENIPKIDIASYNPPELKKSSLPQIIKPKINVGFNKKINIATEIDYPLIKLNHIDKMKSIHVKYNKLPNKTNILIPDVNSEELTKILLSFN